MTVTVNAYAKLNLFLDITGIMPNGYHYLTNVTQSVSLYDTVTITAEKSEDFAYNIYCDNSEIPCDKSNIAYKAARVFFDEVGFDSKVDIAITKRIPIMGGMGGSSVDGAAVLAGLNRIFGNPLSKESLCALGEKIGADVPLCLIGGTLLSDKDAIRSLNAAQNDECFFVCVQPDFKSSTAAAYSLYDRQPIEENKAVGNFLTVLSQKGMADSANQLYNIFTVLYGDNRIGEIKDELLALGAAGAEMTGSGSVVYGVFSDKSRAKSAEIALRNKYPRFFICTPIKCGIDIL